MWKTFRSATLAVFCTFCMQQHAHAATEAFVDLEGTAGLDDNVTRAGNDIDVEYDSFVKGAASYGRVLFDDPSNMLEGNLDLDVRRFFRFEGLSRITAGARLKYIYNTSNAFGAPWYALDGELRIVEFDSDLRSSNIYAVNATFGKAIDDRTSLRSAIGYRKRDSDGRAFDTDNATFFVNIDWRLWQRSILYTTYRFETGDIFSSASLANIDIDVLDNAKAIEPDDVFADKLAYRLDGKVHLATIGYNHPFDLNSSLDVSARYLFAMADDADLDYEGLLLLLTYFYRVGL